MKHKCVFKLEGPNVTAWTEGNEAYIEVPMEFYHLEFGGKVQMVNDDGDARELTREESDAFETALIDFTDKMMSITLARMFTRVDRR